VRDRGAQGGGKIPDKYSTNSLPPCIVSAGQRLHEPRDSEGSRCAGRGCRFEVGGRGSRAGAAVPGRVGGNGSGAGGVGPRAWGPRAWGRGPGAAGLGRRVVGSGPVGRGAAGSGSEWSGAGRSESGGSRRCRSGPRVRAGDAGGWGCGNPPTPFRLLGYPPDRGSRHRRAEGLADVSWSADRRAWPASPWSADRRGPDRRGRWPRTDGGLLACTGRQNGPASPAGPRTRPQQAGPRSARRRDLGQRRGRPSLVRTWMRRTRPGPHSAPRRSSSLPWR
jgi:hypothetical protein